MINWTNMHVLFKSAKMTCGGRLLHFLTQACPRQPLTLCALHKLYGRIKVVIMSVTIIMQNRHLKEKMKKTKIIQMTVSTSKRDSQIHIVNICEVTRIKMIDSLTIMQIVNISKTILTQETGLLHRAQMVFLFLINHYKHDICFKNKM